MVEEVRAKGGAVTREPGPVKGGTSVIAFVKDPDGYIFEIIQRGKDIILNLEEPVRGFRISNLMLRRTMSSRSTFSSSPLDQLPRRFVEIPRTPIEIPRSSLEIPRSSLR